MLVFYNTDLSELITFRFRYTILKNFEIKTTNYFPVISIIYKFNNDFTSILRVHKIKHSSDEFKNSNTYFSSKNRVL